MTDDDDIRLISFEARYAEDAVRMWRASKQAVLGVEELHNFEDHLHYLSVVLTRDNRIYLAMFNEVVVGLMATDGAWINQLYIHIDYQGKGIGSRMVNLAKQLSSGSLSLHTFEVNLKARRFYEKHGFSMVGRGRDNEENLPDVLLTWNRS